MYISKRKLRIALYEEKAIRGIVEESRDYVIKLAMREYTCLLAAEKLIWQLKPHVSSEVFDPLWREYQKKCQDAQRIFKEP